MSDQPAPDVTPDITPDVTSDVTPDVTLDLTQEQQRTMDGVEHSIDEAKQAEADLRATAPGALTEAEDDPAPDDRDLEA